MHCGLSLSMPGICCSSSSGTMGAALSTTESRFTVETVTRRRKVVSTREHLLMGWQCRIDWPRGSRIADLGDMTHGVMV